MRDDLVGNRDVEFAIRDLDDLALAGEFPGEGARETAGRCGGVAGK
jgi:hypothetical protein